jgi:hypothetical protein
MAQSPNPHRVNACPGCGSYRADGRAPYLHHPGCPHEGDLQIDRFLAERLAGDAGGPPLWCLDAAHNHESPPDIEAALDRLRNTATLPKRKD